MSYDVERTPPALCVPTLIFSEAGINASGVTIAAGFALQRLVVTGIDVHSGTTIVPETLNCYIASSTATFFTWTTGVLTEPAGSSWRGAIPLLYGQSIKCSTSDSMDVVVWGYLMADLAWPT
jgi:hypothetical protein